MRSWSTVAKARAAVALAIVLFLAFGARSFRIQHANGDQRVYVAMAMKLGSQGLGGYDVYDVKMRRSGDAIAYTLHESAPGDLVRSFRAEGTPFYEQPSMHAPPLFPALILAFHRLFGPREGYLVLAHDRAESSTLGFFQRLRLQFYCAAPPLLFGALLILCAFELGHRLFGPDIGLLSALLLAAAPILYLCTQRVWADTLLATASSAALLSTLSWTRTRSLAALCGAAFWISAALLTKNNALLGLAAVVVGALLLPGPKHAARPAWLDGLLFAAIVVALTAFWYLRAVESFGTPFFNPSQPGISQSHPWFQFLAQRPWSTFLVGIPYQNPLVAGAYVWILGKSWRRSWDRPSAMIAIHAVGYLLILSISTSRSEMLGPDHRYMLPAYPALMIASALAARAFARDVQARFAPLRPVWTLAVLVGVSVVWSLWITSRHLDADVLLAPF